MFSITLKLFCLILLPGILVSATPGYVKSNEEDIRIDVSSGGQVHVENEFGDVTVEVWSNKYVSVAATVVAGSAKPARSPIVVDNRGKFLLISVVRSPIDPVVAIHLYVRIPDTSHLEVVTTSGRIFLRGLSSSGSLKSQSGDIQTTLPAQVSANINARSVRGIVKSDLAAKTSDSHSLQARLGSASQALDAQSESGQITISTEEGLTATAREKPDQPQLVEPGFNSKAAGTPAGETQAGEISEGDVIRVDSQLVSVNMNVIDRNTNRGLVGLTQSDFKLFEDGQEQQIVQFESASAPFDLILLIDLSGSTKDVVKLIRAAALRFIDAARPADRIGVITFAGEATVVSPVTADRDLLRNRINTIDTARGDTKLYDATEFAINEATKQSGKSRRTAIVLMSDGLDGTIPGVNGQHGSVHPYRDVLNHVQEFDGVLYSLWLNTEYESFSPLDTQPEAFDAGHDRMKEMADAGGGMFYEVEHLGDLAGAYEQVIADLGTVYTLSYRPSNKTRDGKWRAIRIGVVRPNAAARGKRGYYAN